ncbi:MAG TPA: FecR domain-containing protein [Burkholderiales bacterium]
MGITMRAMRSAAVLVVLVCFTNWTMAATVQVVRLQGSVTAQVGSGPEQTLKAGDTLRQGTTITTGQSSNVVLRFDDGQVVALKSLSRFTIESYRYDAKDPSAGQMILSLLSGGMRAITGLVANSNRSAFALKTPVATIGIRGTDFLAALSQGLYNQVKVGSISVTTSKGAEVFGATQYAFTASPAVLPSSVAPSALPAGIFTELEAIALAGAAGGASVGAGMGLSPGAALGIGGLIVIGIGAGLSATSDNDEVTPTTHH